MTEITTSVLFLVASLYGSGQAPIAQISNPAVQATVEKLEDNEVFRLGGSLVILQKN
jgi:hypothetical protein